MNIELIDVIEHSEKEVIAEINKIVPILIERYNDYEVAYWWVISAYEQNWIPTDKT